MITAIVQFPLPAGVSLEMARSLFEASTPAYRAAPGLVRKYYLFGEDRTGGGVYLWENRTAADRFYSPGWRKSIVDAVGAEPKITFFDTPVIVDNALAEAA
jgi:hypothetical protein